MIAIRKHFILVGKIGAAGIHKIDAWQMICLGNFLCTQMLFHGEWVICPALDRGIIGDDHHVTVLDPAYTGDNTGTRCCTVVHGMSSRRAYFEKRRTGIQQPGNALARQDLAT